MKNLTEFENIYFLGVGGNGLSPIAQWYTWNGKKVFGYDKTKSANTNFLESIGIKINFEDKKENIPTDIIRNLANSLIIYTPALGNNNPQSSEILSYLSSMSANFITRHDFFHYLTSKHKTIAVAGTHGKTSTTALIANILHKSSIKAISFVGGILKEYNTGFFHNCLPNDDYIVNLEADEYDRFFLSINYDLGVVTTCDSDHLDFYKSEELFKEAFLKFINNGKDNNSSIYLHDTVDNKTKVEYTQKQIYSLNNSSIRAECIHAKENSIYFKYINEKENIEIETQLPLSGIQQVENSCAAISVAMEVGVSTDEIKRAMESYQGVERRFSIIKNNSNKIFIDDFAHHPVEIRALINSVKSFYSGKKILGIFQSHTYTRTRDYLDGFAKELSMLDYILIMPIFAARERDMYGVSSKNIFDLITTKNKAIVSDSSEISYYLKLFNDFDIILTIGAGDVFSLTKNIVLDHLYQLEQNNSKADI